MDGRSRGKRRAGNAKTVRVQTISLIITALLIAACASTEPVIVETQAVVVPPEKAQPSVPASTEAVTEEDVGQETEPETAQKPAPVKEPETDIEDRAEVAAAKTEPPPAPETMTPRTLVEPVKPKISTPPSHAAGSRRPPRARVQSLSVDQIHVLESAFDLLGLPPDCPVTVNGRNFKLDCIGTVSAIFYKLGIDITKDFNRYTGNGVGRLFKSLKDKGALHLDRFPKTGDIVFWNNTWDANGDRNLKNDPTTHAGVVLQVEDDGTIHYVHEHVRKGVIVERMNLYRPEVYRTDFGKILNNAMALGSYFGNPNNPEHWLSGDLWYQFGGVLTVKDQYQR